MNREYFETIALELDKVLINEAERLKKEKSETDKIFLDFGVITVITKNKEEADLIIKKLVEKFMELAKESDDFNTTMLAFMSLYNFLKIEKMADRSILENIGTIFKEGEDKEYFAGLMSALEAPSEEAFLKLLKMDTASEAAYMCLAVIYLQKILHYRTHIKEKNYNGLAYCLSKIDYELRMVIFYGYRLALLEPVDICEWKSFQYYNICLPQIWIREERDVAMAYESGNKETAWLDYVAKLTNCKTLHLYPAVINDGKMYDVMADIVCMLGNYPARLEQNYDKLFELQEERHNIIRDFSHTYENMQAAGLKEIADILIESTDSQVKQCGRVILAEYGMKDSLKAEVNLMRLNFEDDQSEIARLIRKGVCDHSNEDTTDINGIFEEALKICMLRVIYSGNPKGEDEMAKFIYRRIKVRAGSMKELVTRFEEEVILKNSSVRFFLKNFGVMLDFDFDEEWGRLCFIKNKHTEVLFRSIFAEMITNSLKYADLSHPVSYTLQMKDDIFGITQRNTVTETVETDSGFGLSSKGQILEKMNGHRSYDIRIIPDGEGSSQFTAIFLIDKKLLSGEE